MKLAARPVTLDDCCCATTVTSVTTPTAWTRPFTQSLKEPGSASGGVVFLSQLGMSVLASLPECLSVLSSGV